MTQALVEKLRDPLSICSRQQHGEGALRSLYRILYFDGTSEEAFEVTLKIMSQPSKVPLHPCLSKLKANL